MFKVKTNPHTSSWNIKDASFLHTQFFGLQLCAWYVPKVNALQENQEDGTFDGSDMY